MTDAKIVGYVCTFCGIWYDYEIHTCVKCKEYKGITPLTQEEWDIGEL